MYQFPPFQSKDHILSLSAVVCPVDAVGGHFWVIIFKRICRVVQILCVMHQRNKLKLFPVVMNGTERLKSEAPLISQNSYVCDTVLDGFF